MTALRLFDQGPDSQQLFDCDLSRHQPLQGRAIVLARDRGRALLAIHGRDMDKPSWVPNAHLRFKIHQGQIHEEFGEGVATMPEWLWLSLDQLAAAALRDGRYQRIVSDAEKKREAAATLRRQEKAHLAAARKRKST